MGKEVSTAEDTIKTIKRKTRRQYSAEEKIRIVLEGMRGEEARREQGPDEGRARGGPGLRG